MAFDVFEIGLDQLEILLIVIDHEHRGQFLLVLVVLSHAKSPSKKSGRPRGKPLCGGRLG
jgi:hypothetical protein